MSKRSDTTDFDRLFEGLGTHMSVEDVVKVLGLGRAAVYNQLKSGAIPGYRIGSNWVILTGEVREVMLEARTKPFEGTPRELASDTGSSWAGMRGDPTVPRVLTSVGLDQATPPSLPAGGPSLWWLGVHGGAGESTLEELYAGTRASGHAWPAAPARVVLVARTHAAGLGRAAEILTEAPTVPVELVGLALIADAPGRLPAGLAERVRALGQAAPKVWELPWVPGLREGQALRLPDAPPSFARLGEAIGALPAVSSATTPISEKAPR